MSLLVRTATLALTACALLALSVALTRYATGRWVVGVVVVNEGRRGAPDYVKTVACAPCEFGFRSNNVSSLEKTVSITDTKNMAAMTNQQKTLAVDLGALLDAGDGAMVSLIAGETQLAVHRAVLVSGSPVFAAMFSRNTLEARTGEATIQDVEGPVLRQLVAFLYTGRAPQLSGMALHLLAAAEKYGVAALKAACEQQLMEKLTVENAAATAMLAVSTPTATGDSRAAPTAADSGGGPSATAATITSSSSVPTTAESSAAPTTTTHPHSNSTHPPDDAAISHLRNLSQEERDKRLIQAAGKGLADEVRALLAAGADVGAKDKAWYKGTALHRAALQGHTAVVRLLLAASADPDVRDAGGMTPLHWAAMNGYTEIVAALLEAGASRDPKDERGLTAEVIASQYGHYQLVKMLQ